MFETAISRFFVVMASIVLTLIVGLAGYAIFKSAQADGNVAYCYTEYWSPSQMPPQYKLMGFRPWRNDRFIGNFPSLEDARKGADTYGCKLDQC